jgi:hypothetical protein
MGHSSNARYRVPMMRGKRAELGVYRKLLHLGFRDVRRFAHNAAWDIEVDGYPVEVKASVAYPSRKHGLKWSFLLRDWKSPLVMPVIAYVLCLEGVPGTSEFTHLVIPGPIEENSYKVSLGSLEGDHIQYIDNWSILQPVQYPLIPRENIEHLILPAVGFPASSPEYERARLRSALRGQTWDERKRICKEWQTRNSR